MIGWNQQRKSHASSRSFGGGWVRAHFPEQRLVIEPIDFSEEEKKIFSQSTIYKSFHFISSHSFWLKKIHFNKKKKTHFSLDSIDSLSKNSETFCVFEIFILFSGINLIPVKISFILFLRSKVVGGGFNKYFNRSFSLFSPVSILKSQDTLPRKNLTVNYHKYNIF